MAVNEPSQSSGNRLSPAVIFLTLLSVALIAVMIGYLVTREETVAAPADNSPEAGFARDMIIHHNQAVEMALILQTQGENPTLKSIALNIVLTQQNHIGQMQGWLALWGLPYATDAQPMAWMDMAGRMPGMASQEQLEALRNATGEEADLLFIELMIAHHQGAIHMVDGILERTEIDAVKGLAASIKHGQEHEIERMEGIAEQLGVAVESDGHTHEHEGTAEPDDDTSEGTE